jgi:hypothetical protein
MAERDERGKFLNGHALVGGGRPRGSRVKLSEAFLSDLNDSWDTHGVKALNTCATTEPTIFCRIVASILPKKIDSTLEVNVFDNYDLSDAQQFAQAYKLARQMLGVAPIQQPMIEVESDRRDSEFADDE